MRNPRRFLVALASVSVLAAGSTPLLATPAAHATPFNVNSLTTIQRRLISSALLAVMSPTPPAAGLHGDDGSGADGAPNTRPSSFSLVTGPSTPINYVPSGAGQCATNLGANFKVNTNCLNVSDPDLQGRGQANNETSIAQDPFNANHLVASNNDYVRGDGTCGASYSLTGGATWNNSTVPDIFTRGAAFGGKPRQYWGGGGDTSVAWDTKGNAYLSCQLFNRGDATSSNPDQSSQFVVFRSTGNSGASWNFPGRDVAHAFNSTGAPFEDKQLLTVDNHVGSPFQDRIYVSWTEFAADGSAYIYESYSKDYGETFSPRALVSGNNTTLCTNDYGISNPSGNCNENQFSDPFTGSDGALYVVYNNFNNPASLGTTSDNRNQVLMSKSVDGGATFSLPVKVSDYYDLPDCDTYQGAGADSGRACVPEKGTSAKSVFRATNYPSGAVNPTNSNQVVVTFGSYINAASQESNGCIPASFSPVDGQDLYTGVKAAGACNNKILISTSSNAGTTFTGTTTDPRAQTLVSQAPSQVGKDQFWEWAAFGALGRLAVAYYDRQYGSDETTGSSDVSMSSSLGGMTTFFQQRATSSSMPPPTQFGGPAGGQFYGDYIGISAGSVAHPIWSDTRSQDVFICPGTAVPGVAPALCSAIEPNGLVANDEEIYTAIMGLP